MMTDDPSTPRPRPGPAPVETAPDARSAGWTRAVLPWCAGAVVLILAAVLVWSVVRVHQRNTELSASRLELSADQQIDAARSSALKAAQTYAVDFGSYD